MSSIAELKQIDENYKPTGAVREWTLAHEYYEDRSRSTTIALNESLGVGIGGNAYPIEIGVFSRVIRRLASTYRAPASRWLLDSEGERLGDEAPAQRALTDLFRRMRYDIAWRRIDRLRTLFRQVVIRFYPSSARRAPVARVFAPYNVIRNPSASDGDVLSEDREFALRTSLTPERWEHWQRDPETGLWKMSTVEASGGDEAKIEGFEATRGFSPYGALPAMLCYDEDPLGSPWLPPKSSRTALQCAINAKSNDLWALVRSQAHDDRYWATDDPELLPDVTGPGVEAAVPKDARLIEASPSPRISESEAVLRTAIKLWLVSEGIPSADLDDSKTILTGAALRVQERELRERREESVELARSDERLAWSIVRAINNVHAEAWGVPSFDETAEIDIELADVEAVTEPRIDQAYWHAEISAGYASAIDWIRRRDNIPRDAAIRLWARTQRDLATYPTLALEPTLTTGPEGHPGGEREVDDEAPRLEAVVDA